MLRKNKIAKSLEFVEMIIKYVLPKSSSSNYYLELLFSIIESK